MSITSNVYFFTVQNISDYRDALDRVVAWTGAEVRVPEYVPYSIWRTVGEERAWEFAKRYEEFGGSPFQEEEMFDERDPKQISSHFLLGTSLFFSLSACPVGHRIMDAIVGGIPESIRGNFAPADVSLRVGEHDIIEVNFDQQSLAGRATVSVNFFGYGVSNDGNEMRRMFWTLPEVIQIRKELSAIIGDVEMSMSFYA